MVRVDGSGPEAHRRCLQCSRGDGAWRHFRPILERGGLRAGADFDLVFSPERVKSQSVLEHLTRTPKIVGGLTPAAAERAATFYGRYLGAPVIRVDSLEAAELVKLAGMLYRDVNIALSNELARYAEAVGVDLRPVIAAANNEESMRFPGWIEFASPCTSPNWLGTPGREVKSSISLFSRNPAPATVTRFP